MKKSIRRIFSATCLTLLLFSTAGAATTFADGNDLANPDDGGGTTQPRGGGSGGNNLNLADPNHDNTR